MKPVAVKLDDGLGMLPVTVVDSYSVGDYSIWCCTWDDEESHGPFILVKHEKSNEWSVSSGHHVEVATN